MSRAKVAETVLVREKISRRQFARTVGAAGAALVVSRLDASAGAAAARAASDAPAVPIQLSQNENPYGPCPRALEAITRSQSVAARYPHDAGRLVDALAKLHKVQPANIVLGCGSTEILRMADMAFLGPEKNVVVAEPTYEAVLGYARITRAEAVKVPLTSDHRHDLPAMAAACDAHTGLVYICNPNNPTGTIVTGDELAQFMSRVPRSATVLVDEAYHHFVEDPRYSSVVDWLPKYPNLVIARTFSKIYGMAGMRLGYAISSAENIRAMNPHLTRFSANILAVSAALASLEDPDLVSTMRKKMNDTRRWLCRELEKDGRRYMPSEANFVMIDVGSDVQPMIGAFAKRSIVIGRKFPALPNWLRISIGTPQEMEAFVAALREIVPARATKAA